MKNLTIKKVALGVFLAGFAASGAYAASSAVTAKTIIGNAPTIKSASTVTPPDGKYSFVVKRNGVAIPTSGDGSKARVGDTVEVTFVYNDVDGDNADSDWLGTTKAENLVIAITGVGDITTFATRTAPTTDGTSGTYSFVIPDTAANNGLTIKLTPISEYGAPYKGTTISGNLFGAIGVGTAPDTCADGANPTACIADEFEGLKVQIVKGNDIYGSSDNTEQTAAAAAAFTPTIGDTFNYVVIDTLSSNAIVTGDYKAAWSYAGNNSAALGNQSTAGNTTAAAPNSTYKIDVNDTDALSSSKNYVAGAQGFNLQVTIAKP